MLPGLIDVYTYGIRTVNLEVVPADIPADLREARLDRGERDTLVLAERLGSPLVLMDETVGSQPASAG